MKEIQAYKFSQNLASAALLYEITVGSGRSVENNLELLAVMLHFSASVSQTVTISHVDANDATTYLFVLDSSALSSATNYVFRPAGEAPKFKRGDIIRIACTNSGTPASIVYGKAHVREVV